MRKKYVAIGIASVLLLTNVSGIVYAAETVSISGGQQEADVSGNEAGEVSADDVDVPENGKLQESPSINDMESCVPSLETAPEEQSDALDEQLAEGTYLPYEGAVYRLLYSVEEDGITITGIDSDIDSQYENNGQLLIPTAIEGRSVVRIGDRAFADCRFSGDLVIPENVAVIGERAFAMGRFSGKLVIPESLKSIEDFAFWRCQGLEGDLTIPENVVTIGSSAFGSGYFNDLMVEAKNVPDYFYERLDCNFTGKLILQESVVNIGERAFRNCPLVNGELVIPNSVVNIGKDAFENCNLIEGELNIPDGVVNIGDDAFRDCTGLTALKIPDSVERVGDRAFYGCSNLRNIEVSAGVGSIGASALGGGRGGMPAHITVLGKDTVMEDTTMGSYYFTGFIYGYRGSKAEEYTEDPYNRATFVPLDAPEVTEHRVTTSQELLDTIGSYRHIILADGIYEIPSYLPLIGMVSLTIEAENPGKAEILSQSTVVPVVEIEGCMGIKINGCILGHETVEDNSNECGGSEAYVISGGDSIDVKIENCDLYGCGTEGGCFGCCENVSIENCVIRDCMRRIASASMTENLNITNCVISGNAYDEELARTYEAMALHETDVSFTNSLFVNNYNTKFDGDPYNTDEKRYELQTTACSFYNNAWDGETPGTYGICLNGITWQLDGDTLKIGYPLQLGTDKVIQSAKGSVLPYSDSSLPWKKCSYQQVDVAEGVEYDRGNGVTVDTSGADIEVAVPMTSEEYKSLLSGILTQEEMQAVEEGQSAEVEIVVADGETAVPEKDKQTIENTALDECYAVGKYLDITMYIQVGNDNKRAVEQTMSPLRLVLEIPEELQNDKYNFAVIRMHNEKVDLLTDLDENPSTVTIETALFSTYALVYGAAEGITGVVSGFGAEDEEMLIRVVDSDGAVVAATQATGGKALYMLENVPAGSYTLRVEKKNHVSRDYSITITAGRAAIQNIELWLTGDVDGNGRVNARDKKLIYNHIAGGSQLTDYAFYVGDVDGNGRINAKDSKMIYNHIAGMTLLWE